MTFGLSGYFLNWLGTFLQDRSLCMVCGLTGSSWVPAPYCLPQGSVPGSFLYIIYTSDLALLLATYAVLGQLYVDDVQAYVAPALSGV